MSSTASRSTLATTVSTTFNSSAIKFSNQTIDGLTTENFTNFTSPTTETTSLTSELTTAGTTSTTTHRYQNEPTEDEGSNTSAIVGGIIGGVLGVIVILAVVLLFYRRRHKKKKTPKEIPMAPGKDDLEQIDMRRTQIKDTSHEDKDPKLPIYTNLDESGRPNDKTDPALDDEGYLKKQKPRKKLKKKSSEQEIAKERDNDLLPRHPAPPAPHTAGYVNLKVSKSKSSANQGKQGNSKGPEKRNVKSSDPKYVNAGNKPGVDNSEKPNTTVETGDTFEQENYENVENGFSAPSVSERLYENTKK